MKLLLVWFFVGVLEVPFIRGEQPRWRAGHSYPGPLPQELMVDAVNYIGLVLLHAHNQNNENNIALSPYGATSVLVALGEGVRGTALNEILRATLLPLDVSVTRVGLRDIHRHLKSYFIPQEGFLAGLTFSHENVTLKSSYEDILRFYGYDVDSFNNALYPDPYSTTTNVGSDSTTESLSSVSYIANISSSTAQTTETTPATVVVPSTIDNRDDINSSESTTFQITQTETGLTGSITVQTTQVTNTESSTVQSTRMSTVGNDAIPESTSIITVVTPTPSTTTATTTVPVTTTTTVVPVTTTTITVPVTTITTNTAPVTTTTTVPATSTTAPVTTATVTTTTSVPTTTTTAPATTTTVPVTTITTSTAPATTTTTVADTTTTAPVTTTTSVPTVTTAAPATTISTTAQVTTTSESRSTTTSTVIPSSTTVTTTETTTFSSTGTNEDSTLSSGTSAPIRTRSTLDTTIQTTTSSTTTPVNTAATTILQTTTVTQSTRPTAVTISVVPSTIGGGNDESTTVGSTTGTTPTTQFQNTGPIVISLQPTTITSTSTANSATESTTATESVPTTITVPSSEAASSGSTTAAANTASTTTISSSSTTLTSNSEPTAFTIDLVPSTIGTGSTSSISTSTVNPIPTLITPVGDLPDGFEIDVRPSTVTPRNVDITMTENERNARMVTSIPSKKKSRPRFQDDVELVKSAATHKVAERSFISDFGPSKTSFTDKGKPDANNNHLSKNMKEITIEASIGKTSSDSSTTSTPDFKANTSDDFDSLSGDSNTTEMHSSMNETDFKDLNDEDIIVVNREVDFADQENVAEIVLSEEEPYSASSIEKHSILTEDDFEGKTRGTRSVIDYLIARYHDNNPTNIHMSTGAEYEPMKPTTFAVNGKIRESNINFMTYDTVLPFRYISYLNALALTFPLDSSKYYLLLILPLDEMGIDNLISNMMSTTLKQIIYHLQPTRVKATIPSFMLKGYVVLTPTLQKLGIRKIFEPRHADFSRMTDDKDIYVTNIEQAVTVTIRNYVDPSTLQNNQQFRRRGPVQFTADHPFLYFVMDSQIHVALMAGKIINPLNSRIR